MPSWNPKKWFGRSGKEKPAPAPAPQAPQSPQAPAGAPAPKEKKPGLLGKLFGRGKGKEAPPAPPAAPPAAPPTPPAAPPAEPAEPERRYPKSISVEAEGDWIISSTEWSGRMSGTIRGHKAQVFIVAFEKGHMKTCAQMVADAWDTNVASQIIPEQSTIEHIGWT